jgi:ADP-heptose:LPS heptosyltransferase
MNEARILICRGGALGDLLLTFPAIRAIRRHWPGAAITLAAYPPQSQLALWGGLVDDLFSLDSAGAGEWFVPETALPPEQSAFLVSFDVAISFLHDPDGHVAGTFHRAGIRRVVLHSPLVADTSNRHAIDHFMDGLRELGISGTQGEAVLLDLPDAIKGQGARHVEALGGRVVAIHPGSGSPGKNWALEKFARLAELIMDGGVARAVFVLGEAERGMEERLLAWCPQVPQVKGLDIAGLAGFLRNCRFYVGNDSGVTHLAAATGIPVVALFGRTRPAVWAPRGTSVRVVDANAATPRGLFHLVENMAER